MAQDWAKDLLRAFPLSTAVKANLYDAAYDDDWETFTAKLTAQVQPKTDRDRRLLDARLLRADRARQSLNATVSQTPAARGFLDRAADVAFTSLLSKTPAFPTAAEEAKGMIAERAGQPPTDFGYAKGPLEVFTEAAEKVRSGIMGEADRAATLEDVAAQERAVLAYQRAGGVVPPATLEAMDRRLAAARQAPSPARAALSAAVSAPVATTGVMLESATSPFGLVTAGTGAIPTTARGLVPAAMRTVGQSGVAIGTGLGAQQSLQNAERAFRSGTPEEQIMAAVDVASTGLGLAGMAAPTRLAQVPISRVPSVARQIAGEQRAGRQQRRDIKRDVFDQSALNTAAPQGQNKPMSGLAQKDVPRLRAMVAEGAQVAGYTPDTMPSDLDGFTAFDDALEAAINRRYNVFRQVGDRLLANYTTQEANYKTALANAEGNVADPKVVKAQTKLQNLRDRAFVTVSDKTVETALKDTLKETPSDVKDGMAYLRAIGDPLNPNAPTSFAPMTVTQALDRINYINKQLRANNRLGEQGSQAAMKRSLSKEVENTALMLVKDELHNAIAKRMEIAQLPDWNNIQQDIAVATKIKNRFLANEFTKNNPATGEMLTLPERLMQGVEVAAPVVGGGLIGGMVGEPLLGTIAGGGISAPAIGRFIGRQIGYEGRGNTKNQVAAKLFARFVEEGQASPLPRPTVPPVPALSLKAGAVIPPPPSIIPARDVQIAQAMEQGPPVPLVKDRIRVQKNGGQQTVIEVLDPLSNTKISGGTFLGPEARARAQALANQYVNDPTYRNKFETLMQGFRGSDADLQVYIQKLQGRKPSPPSQSAPPATPTPATRPAPVASSSPAFSFAQPTSPAPEAPMPAPVISSLQSSPTVPPSTEAIPPVGPVTAAPPSPLPIASTAVPATAPTSAFALPKELSKASPRYGSATLTFASDYDRAAYILANDERNRLRGQPPSKAADKFKAALEAQGYALPDVVRHGRAVIQAVKDAAGGGAAPQEAMSLTIQPVATAVAPAAEPARALPPAPTSQIMPGATPAPGRDIAPTRQTLAGLAGETPSRPSETPLISAPFEADQATLTPMGEFLLRWMAADADFRWKSEVGAASTETGKLSKYLAAAGREEGWVPNEDPRWTRSLMAKQLHQYAETGQLPDSVKQWIKVLSIAWDPAQKAFDVTRVSKADFPEGIRTSDQLKKALPDQYSLMESTSAPLESRLPALGLQALELFGDQVENMFGSRLLPDEPPF